MLYLLLGDRNDLGIFDLDRANLSLTMYWLLYFKQLLNGFSTFIMVSRITYLFQTPIINCLFWG